MPTMGTDAEKVQHYIDITPVGLQTPEGCKRVEKAQREWDTAAHMLCNELKEMLDDSVSPLTRDDLHQFHALIGVRDRKQEAFLRAVAGAPERS